MLAILSGIQISCMPHLHISKHQYKYNTIATVHYIIIAQQHYQILLYKYSKLFPHYCPTQLALARHAFFLVEGGAGAAQEVLQ